MKLSDWGKLWTTHKIALMGIACTSLAVVSVAGAATMNSGKRSLEPEKIVLSDESVPLAGETQESVTEKKEEKTEILVAEAEKQDEKQAAKTERKNQKVIVKEEKQAEKEAAKEEKTQQKPDTDQKDAYRLVWEDNFDGTELNMDDWNYEYHEPGWVNAEWQEYVDAKENIYIKDGNLVIQPIKTIDGNGNAYYTSGRINTQNKHDFTYGKFEARLKVPSGKGFLPAFWMMPTDESFYGQWPKCGEIDIMEVLGDNTTTAHGTLHFGEPHTQRQGTYQLEKGDFSSEYHVFTCEWEPGEIRFYVDGNLYFTENDWFTKRNGFGEVAYPAPYDQPFYLILNVAVGGSWVGYPDETTEFGENAQMVVDYVRVYQKDSYDENVEKPVREVVLREPDATGNYVMNGDFAVNESITDDKDWKFMTALNGVGQAEISNGELHISTTNAGTADYSIQMVQPSIPLEKGYQYQVSFDAYADADRTMIASVTAPDLNYIRYMADTRLALTTEKQHFAYTFDMTSDSDANGRMEFNLGNQQSAATVHIDNVRIEKVKAIEIAEEKKGVLPDGNYVYNGSFSEGTNRMDYWAVENTCEGAKVFVTNSNLTRELKSEVPATVTALEQVIAKQPVAILGGKTYKLTFTGHADAEKTVKVSVAGEVFDVALATEKTAYSYTLETAADVNGSELCFLLGAAGVSYIDDVRIQEVGMIVNGDFVNGMVGWEPYVNESAKVSYGVDELTEKNIAMGFTIENTGTQDWMIQLKQNNIKLEEGKCYRIKFDARSTIDRTIMYALQRDGSSDDDWFPYSGTLKIDVNANYQTYEHVFKMERATDEKTILSISMGAVNGTQIAEKHTVYIDNVTLEEVPESELPQEPEVPEASEGTDILKNGDFAQGGQDWIAYVGEAATGNAEIKDGKAIFNITNVGTADWHAHLKQNNVSLEQGASYQISFKIKSSEARTFGYGLLDPQNGYKWYGGADEAVEANVEKQILAELTITEPSSTTIDFQISLGNKGANPQPSVVEIYDLHIIKLGAENTGDSGNEGESGGTVVTGENMIKNGNFTDGEENWINAITAPGAAVSSFGNDVASYDITNVGTADWNIQLKQSGITLENGVSYELTFDVTSTEARTIKAAFLTDTYAWYGGADVDLEKDTVKHVSIPFTVWNDTSSDITFVISMGIIDGKETPLSKIEIDNVSLIKK